MGAAAGKALSELTQAGASADVRIGEVAQSMLDEVKGDLEAVQGAVRDGDVDQKNELGRSLLYLAAESFSLASVELLIKQGADLNAADRNGYTPVIAVVDKASRHGKVPDEARQCLDVLVAAGADVNVRTGTGRTALFSVVDLKMAKALVTAGAQVNVQDVEGWTALHGIVQRGLTPIAKLLIKEGADVNAKNAKGKPPSAMLSSNRKKMEALLVEHGAKT